MAFLSAADLAGTTFVRRPDYSRIRLAHAVERPDGVLPAGSEGVIVFCYDHGAAYEVEFSLPFRDVVTLLPVDFAA